MSILQMGRNATLSVAIGLATASASSAMDGNLSAETELSAATKLGGNATVIDGARTTDLGTASSGSDLRRPLSRSKQSRLGYRSLCGRRSSYVAPAPRRDAQVPAIPNPDDGQPLPAPTPMSGPLNPGPFGPPRFNQLPEIDNPLNPQSLPNIPGPPPVAPRPRTDDRRNPQPFPNIPEPPLVGPRNDDRPNPRPFPINPGPSPFPPRPVNPLPFPDIPGPPNSVGDVVITNREESPIRYKLNGKRFELKPGYQQTLSNRRECVIEFDRGGRAGFARQTLTPGSYEFEVTVNGWELVNDEDESDLDTPYPIRDLNDRPRCLELPNPDLDGRNRRLNPPNPDLDDRFRNIDGRNFNLNNPQPPFDAPQPPFSRPIPREDNPLQPE